MNSADVSDFDSPSSAAPVAETSFAEMFARQRRALRRRLWPMAATFAGIVALAIAVALLWPPTYQSTGTILIEQQEIPQDFVRSAITSYADQRVQMISQRVTNSANLLEIISKYNLYPQERLTTAREAVVARMRDDIKLEMISADVVDPRQGRATKATIAFSISYKNRSPTLAVAVANELTSLYLRENLESRREQASGTADFLTAESTRIGTQVSALEQKIADFKGQHEKSLPEYAQLNVQLSNRAQDDLRDVSARIRALDQQIVYLDSQLAQINPTSSVYGENGARVMGAADQLKFLQSEYSKAQSSYSPTHPDVIKLKSQIEGLQKEVGAQTSSRDVQRALEQATADLAAARQNHTENHPDVIKLRDEVSFLRQELQNRPEATMGITPQQPDNPAYIQIQANRKAAETERQSLMQQQAQLRAHLDELDKASSAMPLVEKDYNSLVSDLDNARRKYADVQQKQMEAQLASNLESERKGERFTLIEPPVTPEKPVSPNRLLIAVAGFLLGLGAAFAMMQLLEAMDTRVRGRDDLISLLSTPPLVVIPWVKLARR